MLSLVPGAVSAMPFDGGSGSGVRSGVLGPLMLAPVHAACFRGFARQVSVDYSYGYGVEFAPGAQRSFRRLRFELVPAINVVSSRQPGAKFPVGARLAEDVPNLVEVARQIFARKVQHKRLAEAELSFVGDRYIFIVILDVVRQLIIQFVHVGKFELPEPRRFAPWREIACRPSFGYWSARRAYKSSRDSETIVIIFIERGAPFLRQSTLRPS